MEKLQFNICGAYFIISLSLNTFEKASNAFLVT